MSRVVIVSDFHYALDKYLDDEDTQRTKADAVCSASFGTVDP